MNAEEILKRHKLKNTACRKLIISVLLEQDSALSEHEIKQFLPDIFDRVTFYRSLKTLEENKILHRVVLHDSTVKYALSKEALSEAGHPHFHCTRCDEVLCLEAQVNTPSSLPQGFSVDSTLVLLEGTCSTCEGAIK